MIVDGCRAGATEEVGMEWRVWRRACNTEFVEGFGDIQVGWTLRLQNSQSRRILRERRGKGQSDAKDERVSLLDGAARKGEGLSGK